MVRVRFAPSPTGNPHPGVLRIAVLNHLLKLKEGGEFILRIDDTDRERFIPGSEERIIIFLKWLGVSWEEGPDVGGPYAPYRQSERSEIYERYFQELVNNGLIYPCFCDEETIQEMRSLQRLKKQPPHYDGRCYHLTSEERARLLKEKAPVWRFRILDLEAVTVKDNLRGTIQFSPVDLGGDFIVRRSDGSFTYNFTTVIDDHLMKITHIIRGEDHLSNTAKQLAIYDALGWKPPEFFHIPLLVDKTGKKLSKREGENDIQKILDSGILPETLYFYLATLGWKEHPGKPMLNEELSKAFSIDSLGTALVRWHPEELEKWNKKFIVYIPPEKLLKYLKNFLSDDEKTSLEDQDEKNLKILSLIRENCNKLVDCKNLLKIFYSEEIKISEECLKKVRNLDELSICNPLNLIDDCLKIGKELGIGKKKIFTFIRCVLTGLRYGPPLGELIQLMDSRIIKLRWEKFWSRRRSGE